MGGEMKESQSKLHISLYICLYSTLILAFLMMDLDNEEDWAAKTWYTEKKHLTVLCVPWSRDPDSAASHFRNNFFHTSKKSPNAVVISRIFCHNHPVRSRNSVNHQFISFYP